MTATHSTATTPTFFALEKMKVLLAEDNEVNQLLAKGILRHWGFETRIAENGFEVMELLQNEDFDLILMDIQMPGKSGIEAANEIRNLTDIRKKNLPIIALTANALKGEEQKYITAGMDDFLTKPFKEADLYEVIERVMQREGSFQRKMLADPALAYPEKTENKVEKLYNFDLLEELASGNKEFLVALAQIFLDTIPSTSHQLVEASKKGDWLQVSKLAHKLKSTIDTMNMEKIKYDIRTIEEDAKTKINLDLLSRLVVKVDEVIKSVAIMVKAEFNL